LHRGAFLPVFAGCACQLAAHLRCREAAKYSGKKFFSSFQASVLFTFGSTGKQ